MDTLRKPFFVISVVLFVLVVGVQLGSSCLATPSPPSDGDLKGMAADLGIDQNLLEERSVSGKLPDLTKEKPPGMAIPYHALLDGLVLYTILLMALALVVPVNVFGRIQGILTFFVSLVALIGGIVMILGALAKLLIMLALFLSVPFGTLAYIAVWGFFDRGGASAALGMVMTFEVVAGVVLVISHQRFLQNKGLIMLYFTALVGTLIVSFLHGFVPGLLVSITDAAGAIVVALLAVLWALFFLVGSVVAVVKALKPG